MRILVTGDKGFVGSATSKLLKNNGHEVIGYDLMDGYDIRDIGQLNRVITSQQPNRILHLAAIARFADADANPMLAHETNVLGTLNVAAMAEKHHLPLVYASTGSVLMPIMQKPPITEEFRGCGNSVYGVTKYLGELYVKASKAPYIILRLAHLYGVEKRFHGLIGGFLSRIERGLAPKLFGGFQSNDFVYIEDVAEAMRLALEAEWDKFYQIYNVGSGEELTTSAAGEMICSVFGYTGEIERLEQRTVDPDRFFFDCSKAERMLGFKARFDFRAGLEDMKNKIDNESRPRHENLAPRALRTA